MIKGYKRTEVVSVYDPVRQAYYDVPVKELMLQYKSLGLTDEEINQKISTLVKSQHEEEESGKQSA